MVGPVIHTGGRANIPGVNSNSNSASQATYLVLPQQRRGEPELEEGVGPLALAPHERRGLPVHLCVCYMGFGWGKGREGNGLGHTSVVSCVRWLRPKWAETQVQ